MKVWRDDCLIEINVKDLSNEELIIEYGAEVEGESRRISTDPPGYEKELYAELLRRLESSPGKLYLLQRKAIVAGKRLLNLFRGLGTI